jgi:hypothetical protein
MVVEWIDHLEVDTKEALPKLGALVEQNIEADTAQGRKGNDRAMPDLSTRYEMQKIKEGHGSLPDLRRSGRLISQLQVLAQGITKNGKDWIEIGFKLVTGDDVKKFRRLRKDGRDPLSISRADLKRFAKQFVKEGILKEVPGPPKKG